MTDTQSNKPRSKFPPLYWLVVMFEFFERGSYYGVMSVLSVYMTDVLKFSKENVGTIKGTIQPLLYFLPIVAGALADRFGYRRALLLAFALLGGGYWLTAQATQYAAVFLALVVMGLGAGTFKPIVSGTIARCTDESNSTLGFGIFYWSINLGAFVVPLFLVPFLKNTYGWDVVLLAAAIGTGSMLVPTLFLYREPPLSASASQAKKPPLLQTLANAFEIIYSPFILLHAFAARSAVGKGLVLGILAALLGFGSLDFLRDHEASTALTSRAIPLGDATLTLTVERNLTAPRPFALSAGDLTFTPEGWQAPRDLPAGSVAQYPACLDAAPTRPRVGTPDPKAPCRFALDILDPDHFDRTRQDVLAALRQVPGAGSLGEAELTSLVQATSRRVRLLVSIRSGQSEPYRIDRSDGLVHLSIGGRGVFEPNAQAITRELATLDGLSALGVGTLRKIVQKAESSPFFMLYVGILFLWSLLILKVAPRLRERSAGARLLAMAGLIGGLELLLWGMHLGLGLGLFATIVTSVISLTLLSLFAIDASEPRRFVDHFRFLFMIFIYSGFWVLYFQMFDSVLWYVQAYVDASSLEHAVSGLLAPLGLGPWRFDVEHVTVINAGTIILLQLLVSALVKNTRALPTMIAGITLGTLGMAILALDTSIWVFMLGTVIFSIGEMTAHPKFIAYVGQTAPKDRVAMYMGYLFLYGVIGSSIGSPLGASLYVTFVDELNQPRTLWLIFSGIGVVTIVGLLVYNRFMVREAPVSKP